jgi:menaquinone-dependent protoporphyrinogen oxidase
MGSVLVVYGSWTGSTAGVAQRLGKALMARGSRVRVVPAGSAPDPEIYDSVVIGSAIRSGEWHPAAKAWLSGHAPVLKEKPVAFFSVCLTPVTRPAHVAEARGYMLPLTAETGVHPIKDGVFAGVFDPKKLSLRERTKAKLWGAKTGDFRDPVAIDAWVAELAPQLAN